MSFLLSQSMSHIVQQDTKNVESVPLPHFLISRSQSHTKTQAQDLTMLFPLVDVCLQPATATVRFLP